ncbi:hypothetical protein YYC_04831 [Plasmodium yoelii 17X]|uniref:Uncharacterized protein n=1 Tax=Plasmodium yoelii 17X TaxID=1323249 RepID=V7PG54_PLAYE|nr:hypothetical protein YYC_04831 [Plasmodium yoelii 17X]
MNYVEPLENIYLNLYIKRANISYLSSLKCQNNNLIKHNLFNLINTGSVLIVILREETVQKTILYIIRNKIIYLSFRREIIKT